MIFLNGKIHRSYAVNGNTFWTIPHPYINQLIRKINNCEELFIIPISRVSLQKSLIFARNPVMVAVN